MKTSGDLSATPCHKLFYLRERASGEKLGSMIFSGPDTTLFLALSMACFSANAAEELWKAGVASSDITPTQRLWAAGYASRTNMIDGKATSLWVKALALEDKEGNRGVFVTSDLLGIPQSVYQHTCASLKEKFGLNPEQIILSASHTHCAPVLRNALYDIYPFDESALPGIEKYTADLEAKMVDTVGRALTNLAPARLASGQGTAGFAVNRRNNSETDVPALIAEGALKGPVDHSVPVLAVFTPGGDLKVVLFGYACHNTVMDFYKWSGDYAGYAQIALERSHPGATCACFSLWVAAAIKIRCPGARCTCLNAMATCWPRRSRKCCSRIRARWRPSCAPRSKCSRFISGPRQRKPNSRNCKPPVPPSFNAGPRACWRNSKWASRSSANTNIRCKPRQLGGRQLLLTLGGEPVVDYSLRFKGRFGPQTWVAGYCNDVMNYIPSLRVLKEDKPPLASPFYGYEGARATMAYGLPAFRWADDIEELVNSGAERVVTRVRVRE